MNRAGVRGMGWLDGQRNLADHLYLVFPHIINACVFSSALSSVNTALFSASRILYGLALRGQAPKLFTRCTKWGLPLPAIFSCVCGCTPTVCWKFTEVYQSCFAFLALMTISAGSETVFQWVISALVNLACVISFCQSAGSSVFQQRLLFSDGSLSILPFLASVSIFFPWIGLFEYWCLYPPSR